MEPIAAQRAIATLHSFRFFRLVVILPGVSLVQISLQFGDGRGLLGLGNRGVGDPCAALCESTSFFWFFVVSFNLVGMVDLILTYYHAIRVNPPALAGQLGAAYVIQVLYVPVLMITHVAAAHLMLSRRPKTVGAFAGHAAAS